jgi:hypothetical protein
LLEGEFDGAALTLDAARDERLGVARRHLTAASAGVEPTSLEDSGGGLVDAHGDLFARAVAA